MNSITIQYASRNKVTIIKNESTELFTTLAWHVSKNISNCGRVISDNHLQYLTNMEADSCLNDLHNALNIGGTLELNVPDFDYVVSLWLKATWKEAEIRNPHSAASSSIKGIFGEQPNTNPMLENYDNKLLDSFHSCYSKARLKFLLERVGFTDVQVTSNAGCLNAIANKTMNKGERQISTSLDNIRPDHLNRYEFAADFLKNKLLLKKNAMLNILDLACGIGYGSWILANSLDASVTSVDVDSGAIDYAKEYYQHEKIKYLCEDVKTWSEVDNESFDVIVSFETIEHITFDKWLLNRYFQLLRPGGLLIVSTPNETYMPFDKHTFPFHVKHYTSEEICGLVSSCGFEVIDEFMQLDNKTGKIERGNSGVFSLLLGRKMES